MRLSGCCLAPEVSPGGGDRFSAGAGSAWKRRHRGKQRLPGASLTHFGVSKPFGSSNRLGFLRRDRRVNRSRGYPVSAKGTAPTSERMRCRRPARAWAKARAIITVRASPTRALTRLRPRRKCRSNPKSLSRRL